MLIPIFNGKFKYYLQFYNYVLDVDYIGVATGLLGVASNPSALASNPNGNPSQYYTGVASNHNIGMLATPLAVPASPWQPQRENASYASG